MNIEDIWSDYQAGLKNFLHSKISNSADAEDLLQEILIKTHSNLHSINSETSIKSWLYSVANNAISDFYRAKGKTNEITIDIFPDVEDKEHNDVHQALSQCIEPFIQALPPETAELLIAIDIQGQSQKEYAKQAGISYSTLKSRVQKGRSQLRKVFEDCCHFSLDQRGNVLEFTPKSDCYKNC